MTETIPTFALPDPRYYQREAVEAVAAGLAVGGRGQSLAACGTGKTLTAVYAAMRLCPSGLVAVTCPTLALIAQTLRLWATAGIAQHALAACGDDTVADTAIRATDLACPVTTNEQRIIDWLQRQPVGRLRLLLTTHTSADIAGHALTALDTAADLLIVDEAHHTAGRVDKHWAKVHDDAVFPAHRRLYMTATPRVLSAPHRRRGRPPKTDQLISMDDPAVFGPVLHNYPFQQAIDDAWLDDFRVAVVGVTRADVLKILRNADPAGLVDGHQTPLHTAVVQTALAQAVTEFDLRRVLAFTRTIADSREFTRTLQRTLDQLPAEHQPKRHLTALHVDGDQPITQRERHLALLADPPNDGWTVVSNARCLAEGVDVPAVDAVVFTHPKKSEIDVAQAVGRALRRNPSGTGIATILVPVLLADDPDDMPADLNEWETIWQVVRALRAHDSRLAADLDTQRPHAATGTARLPHRIVLRLPDGYATADLLRHITIRLLENTTSDWLAGYAALRDFHGEHGHLRIPRNHRAGGFLLKNWLNNRRKDFRLGRLTDDQIAALDELGIDWEPLDTAWETPLAAARAFHAREGHLRVPNRHDENGVKLYNWIGYLRAERAAGRLSAERIGLLDEIGFIWDPLATAWDRAMAAARAFHTRHGHLNVPEGHIEDGIDLNSWLCTQRNTNRAGTLTADRRDKLEELGIVWEPMKSGWARNLAAATAFYQREGHLRVPTDHREADVALYTWVSRHRRLARAGTVAPDKLAALQAIGFDEQPEPDAVRRRTSTT
ncbi:Helicase associated domain protein [Actinoplanes sp. NPDC051411]|uniref:DEAD/DEAH box helicase n=1 Tax=Actinoplanes sp. NPDC051411 TaxID=3155522 RepID=UPI003418A87D